MSALKKALNKLKSGHHSSEPVSDNEGSGYSTPPLPASAPSGTPLNGGASPRSSVTFARNSGTLSPTLNSGSPRSSGQFTREDSRRRDSHPRHSVQHSPIRAIKDKLGLNGNGSSSDEDAPLNRDGERMSKKQQHKHERQLELEQRKKEVKEREEEQQRRRKEAELRAQTEEPPELRALYGDFPVNSYAGEWRGIPRANLLHLSARDNGREVIFRARIHNIRKMSAHLVFFVFRQQTTTIQGVLHEHGKISSHFLYWAEHLDMESVVLVRGILQEPKAKEGEVKSATIHDIEVSVHEMHAEARVSESLPFTVHEAEFTKDETDHEGNPIAVVGDRTRMVNRVLDLRTTASQSIFRIQAGMCKLFREALDAQGFVEIHTPKLQGGATESGASVFKIDYFGRPAFLAQSPQLAKQMSISTDFRKVYEIGAVFRAENSNTHRHLTEYTGLDIEMEIDEHYHEVLRTLDRTFKHIFQGIYQRYRHEIETVKRHFPHEDLVWLEETPRIPFKEAVQMLNDSGWRDDDGKPLPLDEDLGTRDEIQLGRVVKQRFGTDFYIIDKFPASARPFYTMADPCDPTYTNSFDIFLRGQEILSGGQRIHDADTLIKNMEKNKADPRTMEEYIQGFEWGAPPHGGGGIGLERMLMLFLQLGDIRHASMYPRDPKSLPAKPLARQLRHPEASTLHPPWEGKDRAAASIDWQPIEKLIANYGDATNTSWLEPRTHIWRDEHTGAAVGWAPRGDYAITVGDPLCHSSQYTKIIASYLRWIKKEKNLKPLWLLVGSEVEEILGSRFNWRTFSVAAEQRVDPADNGAIHDRDLQRKMRHAEKEGVKIVDVVIGDPVPEGVQRKVDERVKDWLAGRKGKQVHISEIHPWQDMEHRQYSYAIDKEGTIHALVVMAQLSPEHGWQVKYSLDFPNAPNGTIELIVTHAMKLVAQAGAPSITFGAGATSDFKPAHNLKGTRVKVLSKTYHTVAAELKLNNKTEFREKLGAQQDPIYLCYPPHGLGPMGVKAILSFFEDWD